MLVFLFYHRLTVLLFKRQFKPNKIKNFYSMKTCLDLNNTVDSGIYYLEDNLNQIKSKNFYSMKTCLDLNNTVDSGIYYLEDNLNQIKSKKFL